MTLRLAAMAATLLAAVLVQTVVLPAFAVAGWRPDLVTLVVIGWALAEGPQTGLRVGFAAGLLVDLLAGAGGLLGVSSLVLLLVGYLGGAARPFLASTSWPGLVAVAGALSLLAVVLAGGLLGLLGAQDVPAGVLLQAAVVIGSFNAVLAPVVCWPVAALARRVPVAPPTA